VTTLKNAALALLTIGFSCTAFAAAYPLPPDVPYGEPVFTVPPVTKHGVYVGLGVGALDFNNKMTGTVDYASTSVSQTNSENNVGVNGVLDLGYSWTFPSRLFFGIEGFGNLTSAKNSQSLNKTETSGNYTTTIDDTVDFKWQTAYGARVLPGFQVNSRSVLYGIVGYTRGNAELTNSSNNSTITNNTTATSEIVNGSRSGTSNTYGFNGYQLGVGTMIDLVGNLSLRADVIYSGYSSETLSSNTNAYENGSVTTSLSAEPYTLEGDLSLVYMFG
jgi:opacity protein-like surface antigen